MLPRPPPGDRRGLQHAGERRSRLMSHTISFGDHRVEWDDLVARSTPAADAHVQVECRPVGQMTSCRSGQEADVAGLRQDGRASSAWPRGHAGRRRQWLSPEATRSCTTRSSPVIETDRLTLPESQCRKTWMEWMEEGKNGSDLDWRICRVPIRPALRGGGEQVDEVLRPVRDGACSLTPPLAAALISTPAADGVVCWQPPGPRLAAGSGRQRARRCLSVSGLDFQEFLHGVIADCTGNGCPMRFGSAGVVQNRVPSDRKLQRWMAWAPVCLRRR